MVKTTIKIEGMVCANCEKHVNEAVINAFTVKSVKADKDKGEAEILSPYALDADKLRKVITETGYTPGEIVSKTQKKGLFGLFG